MVDSFEHGVKCLGFIRCRELLEYVGFNPLACVLNTTVVGPPAVVFFHCPFKFCTKLYYNS
jgi:hypothetical protein